MPPEIPSAQPDRAEPRLAETLPLYLALADRVEVDIAAQPPGSRVPSEPELAAEHAVSRLTARTALQELERRLVVHRVRGSGTYVAHRITYPVGSATVSDPYDLARQAGASPTRTLESTRTRRPTPAVRSELDLDDDEKVVTIVRTGRVDGIPAWHGTTHLVHDLVEGINHELAAVPGGGSMMAMLEGFGLSPVLGWTRAELGVLPAGIGEVMGVVGRPLAWDVETGIIDEGLDRPVAITRRWLRADAFRLCFEAWAARGSNPAP